jgi:hypothetical protein
VEIFTGHGAQLRLLYTNVTGAKFAVVLTTPVANLPTVSMIAAANFATGTAGVFNDTGSIFATGVNNTSDK